MLFAQTEKSSPKILVVDDDAAIRRLIERALRSEGYEVHTCPSAEAALSTLQERHDFALVLVDVMMGGETGVQFVTRIRSGEAGADRATIPVVFVTGEDDAKTYEASFDLGAQRYVTKPFSADELINVVSSVLHERA